VFVLVLFQCFAVLGNSFISKPSPEECQLTLYTGRQVKNTFFTTFLCTKLNKLCICDIVISNICLILHSYDVSCCKCTMYDTLDSSPLEKVKLFWQRFQHKLFVFFKDVPLLRYCILKQTWEELQLYLSDHARQFLNLGY
jgi:hypothetical protein